MRAGAFAEKRVIDLVNRRFVPYYFNTGGPGLGKNDGAHAFVRAKTKNRWAFLAAFDPEGNYLGESELYADKDAVFAFLSRVLEEHPEYDGATSREDDVFQRAEPTARGSQARLRAARLREELGDYDAALSEYTAAVDGSDLDARIEASLGTLRITRYRKEWDAHARAETALRELLPEERLAECDADLIMERGHRLLGAGRHAEARRLLQPATRTQTGSPRLGELHFYAGLACWFLDDRDWAKLHWCWILEHLPEDRHYQRARIAAAAEAMPYVNPELGGFRADVGNIGTQHIVAGVEAAQRVYRDLLRSYEAGRFDDAREVRAEADSPTESPLLLVARLRDGNAHRVANNEIVDQLEEIGEPSVGPLVAAIEDERFPGRGYAAWGLSQVLKTTGSRDPRARAALAEAAEDENAYVAALARSGLRTLGD